MQGIGGPRGLDGRGVEVHKEVVADDHLRSAHGGTDRATAVGHVALEDVIGNEVLPGAELGVGVVVIRRAQVPHGHGAAVAYIVAHELHEPRGALPRTTTHVDDSAILHAGVLGAAHHVV